MKPDAESYVCRKADEELLQAVLSGEFCYVLTPRQMGKSSLMARTALRLAESGIRSAQVDLTRIGADKSSVTAEQWYYGVAYRIARELKIPVPLDAWWWERKMLPDVQKFTEFLNDIVLENCSGKVVIFVDEIDSTIGLSFSDDFFAGIRACYNARATSPDFERLSFVLLGVATPAQLISDPTRTPFNIGRGIELSDFTLEEAHPLAKGLDSDPIQGQARLERILYWTGGHPYLTQALFSAVLEQTNQSVDQLVEERFLSAGAVKEEKNLKFVRDRLTQSGANLRKVLQTYGKVAACKPVKDMPASSVHAALKLSGVVKPDEHGTLQVRNRIYERVFNPDWARRETPSERKRYLAVATLALCLLILSLWYATMQSLQTLRTVSTDNSIAYQAYHDLRRNFAYRSQAEDLLALYWARRQQRDYVLLTRIRSLTFKDEARIRREIADLLASDYADLISTERHGAAVTAVAFSPDGRMLLTGSDDNTAQLWRADSGAPIGSPLQHQAYVNAVAFSPDGTSVLTGSEDNTARLWRADTGAPIGPPLQHRRPVVAVAFSPDGKTVLTGSLDQTGRLWRVDTGAPVCSPLQHEAPVSAVAFSPDGETVLTGSWDQTAQLWRVDTGAPIGSPLRHQNLVVAVAFSPDGKTLLTGSADKTARLWRAGTGRPIGSPLRHQDPVLSVAFSPDSQTVLTGGADGTARLWRADTGAPIGSPLRHQSYVKAVAFSPDSKTVLTGSADHTARLWRADTGAPIGCALRHQDPVNAVAFSPDGETVLTGSSDSTARLWRSNAIPPIGSRLQHQDLIMSVAFSPDGKQVLTGSWDRTARLWRADTGAPIGSPLQHQDFVVAVAFSPDGKTVLTGSDDKTARLWRADTGAPIGSPLQHHSYVGAVAFSPDGKSLITGSWDNTAQLWRVDTGGPIGSPLQHQGAVDAVSFSPDGKSILTGSADKTARLWRADTGSPIGSPLQHQNPVEAVAFSPDGEIVLTGGDDHTARFWRANTGAPIGLPLQHQGSVDAVTFSPGGKTTLTRSGDWMYFFSWDGHAATLESAKFLPGGWTRGLRFEGQTARHLQVALRDTGNSVFVRSIDLDRPDAAPIQGDPQTLLKDWEKKLALTFDNAGRIIPLYPVSTPQPQPRSPR
jgi:uncharacterized delta-60 repeat protein